MCGMVVSKVFTNAYAWLIFQVIYSCLTCVLYKFPSFRLCFHFHLVYISTSCHMLCDLSKLSQYQKNLVLPLRSFPNENTLDAIFAFLCVINEFSLYIYIIIRTVHLRNHHLKITFIINKLKIKNKKKQSNWSCMVIQMYGGNVLFTTN